MGLSTFQGQSIDDVMSYNSLTTTILFGLKIDNIKLTYPHKFFEELRMLLHTWRNFQSPTFHKDWAIIPAIGLIHLKIQTKLL